MPQMPQQPDALAPTPAQRTVRAVRGGVLKMHDTSEYPHELVWRKIKENKPIIFIWSLATVVVLSIGYATFWIGVNYTPATDVWTANTLQQPSVISYAPMALIAFCILFGVVVYSYYYGEVKE
jgi:hypothetical protein